MPEDSVTPQAEPEKSGADDEKDEKPTLEDQLKERVEVQAEELAPLRKKLSITIPRDIIDEQINDQYGELQREAQVPGFRKGRAPRRLLEKRFGSEVDETLSQQLVGKGFLAAVDKTAMKPIGDPLIWATRKDAQEPSLVPVHEAVELIRVPSEGPLTFVCEVEIQPEFELPEVEKIPVTRPVIEITDEMTNNRVQTMLRRQGTFNEVTEGGAATDDVIKASFKMVCEGKTIKEEADTFVAVRPQVVEGVVLEKLGETLAGAKAGETRTITVTVPATHDNSEIREKQAELSWTVKKVERLTPAELSESFVKALGFETEQELRDWTRYGLETEVNRMIRDGMHGQVERYLLNNTSLQLPERLSERMVHRAVMQRLMRMYQEGISTHEIEKQMDQLQTTARAQALDQLKLSFIMEKLAAKYKDDIEVTESEMNGAIEVIAQRQQQRFDRVRDQMSRDGMLEDLYVRLRDHKIVEKLLTTAEITDKQPGEKTEDAASSDAT